MKALVVDDEFTNRIILQKFLSRHSEVMVCDNGSAAVDAFISALDAGHPFQLICMDVMMPVMDGPAALAKIRECEEERGTPRDKSVRIILTTGLEGSDSSMDCVRDLADGILTKPVRLNSLMETLASLGLI
jgi:two-component system, chemotaxis family, chemotaxis protein CheY